VGNTAVASVLASLETSVQRALAPAPTVQERLQADLNTDLGTIIAELDSFEYTAEVEETVILTLSRWALKPPPGDPIAPTWLDRLFRGLLHTPKRKYVVLSTNYYDAMLDRFTRVAEIRQLRDGGGCRLFLGRESAAQREETAEKQQGETAAEQGGGWSENVGVDAPIPRTPDNVAKAQFLFKRLQEIPPGSLTRQQRVLLRRLNREGIDFLFHGVHFITAEERNRWKKELAGMVVITALIIAATIVTVGLAEMYAPELVAALVGAEPEAAIEAEIAAEEGAGAGAVESGAPKGGTWTDGKQIKEMFPEAISRVMNAPAAERAALWEQLAKDIEASKAGQAEGWAGSKSMTLTDGGRVFFGEKGPALVFDPEGNVFRGAITNSEHFSLTADGMSANYAKLKKL
jgi:hypothetical protein